MELLTFHLVVDFVFLKLKLLLLYIEVFFHFFNIFSGISLLNSEEKLAGKGGGNLLVSVDQISGCLDTIEKIKISNPTNIMAQSFDKSYFDTLSET